MARVDAAKRPDPRRALEVLSNIDERMLASLLPRVCQLRQEDKAPVTMLINSAGGIIRCAEVLYNAVKVPDPDGESPRLVTFAIGDAGSAAAVLLALGDYAMANRHSEVHFHGIRLSEAEVTMEDASQIASFLGMRNRSLASSMSTLMLPRLVHRYFQVHREFEGVKQHDATAISNVQCFAACLKKRTSPQADRLIDLALRRVTRVQKLSRVLRVVKPDQSGLQQDERILRAIIALELKENEDPEWRLNEDGMSRIYGDYFLLRDFYLGEHRDILDPTIAVFGRAFLEEPDVATLELLGDKEKEKWEFLKSKARPLLSPFLYFTVSLARLLLRGENRLSATDAYWIGVVDEVLGCEECFGSRSFSEREDNAGSPGDSRTAAASS